MAAARDCLEEAVKIWVAFLATADQDMPSQAAADLVEREMGPISWAWRRFPRREPAAGALKAMFGEEAMEHYWSSMAGEHSIRLSKIMEELQA
jgi:hypothetical protein